jgi:Ni/Co efflux regulator RcnB
MKAKRVLATTAGFLLLGATMASAQAPKTAGDMGRHTMDGQVTKVDAKKGWIDVKTAEGSMKLHFPPEALANVKKGDSVSVELGLKDNGPAAPSGSMKSQPK